MPTLSCLFQLLRPRQPLPLLPEPEQATGPANQPPRLRSPRSSGQVLVIFAASLLGLLFFVGLALDAGVLYVNYGQLKRAVDAGSVAAANNFKRLGTNEQMYAAVLEILKLQNVDITPGKLQLIVTTCDNNKDGYKDGHFGGDPVLPTAFEPLCPETDPASALAPSARKLVYVEAQQETPLYFLSLLGFGPISLQTSSTAEAAAVDLMLVIDTSESMGNRTTGYAGSAFDFDPQGCNAHYDYSTSPATFVASTCFPLRNAIDAAKNLVDTLYEGYDNIGLITYDTIGHDPDISAKSFHLTSLAGGNKAEVLQHIDEIQLHDDPPYWDAAHPRMWVDWYLNFYNKNGLVNPANMEDRDGNGLDADPGKACWVSRSPTQDEIDRRWDDVLGVPCDEDPGGTGLTADAYDWDGDGVYTNQDDTDGKTWLFDTENTTFSLVSTCTGCGIRLASNELRRFGRPGAVWVMVLLSDGGVNMSDTHDSVGGDDNLIPPEFPNGFCTQGFWGNFCQDGRTQNKATYSNNPYRARYCIDKAEAAVSPATALPDSATCAPGSVWEPREPSTSHYSVFDYALDMIDEAALRVNSNPLNLSDARYNATEPYGNDIAIYTIGLGPTVAAGVPLLRYAAAVGDDGDRVTDDCLNKITQLPLGYTSSCGQYYYAASGADLSPIFDSIASRIYTKITR